MLRTGFVVLRWLVVLLVVVAVALASWFGYWRWSSPQVTVTDVVEAPVVQAFYATGTLLPDREYPLKSNVEGTITDVFVDKGDPVSKGQPLVVVRVDEYLMRYSQAEADRDLKQKLADPQASPILAEFAARLRAAREQHDVALREYKRLSKLRESNVVSQSEFDRASEQVESARSLIDSTEAAQRTRQLELETDVKVAQAALDIAQWNLDQQTVTSPIDGLVLDRPTSPGTRVPVNGHLLQVADVSPEHLVLRANVDEEDKTRIEVSQAVKVTLYAYEARVFEGRVVKIYPKADPDRRTFEVDIRIEPADPKFAAGMTGELAFVVAEKPLAVVVPSQAVQKDTVWVIRGDQRAEPVKVEVGLRSIERVEILSGLSIGDQVIVSPIKDLTAGQTVRTRRLDPATAAGLNTPPPESPVQGGIETL